MNFRESLSSSKYIPKVKINKSGQKPTRRLQTQANEQSIIIKPPQLSNRLSHKVDIKKQTQKSKFLEVYSKIQQKQSINTKAFKVHTNRPFILSKPIKTEADETVTYVNQTYHGGHQRKISELSSSNNNQSMQNNKYEVDGVAGKGTFGTVYIGHVRGSGKKIAIKKVYQDKKYKNRQLQILKVLHHTNLLQMRDYYLTQEGDKQYLNVVMDFYPQNLYQTIKKKPMNPNLIKIYIYQILRGLMYMNFHDISHRDMKPHNVLVNQLTNKVVICDFGSAKQLVIGQPNLAYICSRCYRAPELIFGATDYTCQIDLWSTGCILVEMINGEPPFLGDSQIDQLIEIIKIMGTPSKAEVIEMNPHYDLQEYSKFPIVKKTEWKNVLKTKDPLLIDLVHNMMQYSPKRRFSAQQALKHKYFDQLRHQDTYKQLHHKVKTIPQLFDFTQQQLSKIKHSELLIPKWVETSHTSKMSTSNLKSINQLSSSNMNISITKMTRIQGQKPSSTLGSNMNSTMSQMGHGYTMSGNIWSKRSNIAQIKKQY